MAKEEPSVPRVKGIAQRPAAILLSVLVLSALKVKDLRASEPFTRGDVNADGVFDLSDAVAALRHLFSGLPVSCQAAVDCDGDGLLTVADPIRTLSFLFSGGAAPAPPFPRCGTDPSSPLTCEAHPPCNYGFSSLTIAAFNIENLNEAKASDAALAPIIADVIRFFDLTAVQEVRDPQAPISLLERINAPGGPPYTVIVSPHVGGNERYALYFREDRLTCMSAWVYSRQARAFLRQPFVASFEAGNFDFTLLCIHANHIDTDQELRALASVFRDLLLGGTVDPDIILLGDLNADCTAFNENNSAHPLRASDFSWLIGNSVDTLVGSSTCTRDRIIVPAEVAEKQYVPGSAGTFRFEEYFQLSEGTARSISDHYPVFASFAVDFLDDD